MGKIRRSVGPILSKESAGMPGLHVKRDPGSSEWVKQDELHAKFCLKNLKARGQGYMSRVILEVQSG